MKPHFHKVPDILLNSFIIKHDIQPNLGKIWHYHPELELHYVIKGEGLRFIGDRISDFSAGEIILLGENLPHTWSCLLYTSPSPRDGLLSRMPSSA